MVYSGIFVQIASIRGFDNVLMIFLENALVSLLVSFNDFHNIFYFF